MLDDDDGMPVKQVIKKTRQEQKQKKSSPKNEEEEEGRKMEDFSGKPSPEGWITGEKDEKVQMSCLSLFSFSKVVEEGFSK